MKRYICTCIFAIVAAYAYSQKFHEGYNGSVEVGGCSANEVSYFTVSTTHGKQLNDRWFVGGGAKIFVGETFNAAVYGDGRCYCTRLKSQKWTPYGELKFGVEFGDVDAQCFMEPSAGIRYNIKNSMAVSASLGWHFDGGNCVTYTVGFHF